VAKTLVRRAYRYRFYPTDEQQRELLRTFGCVRLVYNRALQARIEAWYTRSAFRWREGRLVLAKMATPLDIRWSRPLPAGVEPSTVTVSRDPAGRWHVAILVDTSVAHHTPITTAVGVDAGITSLLALSTGEKVTNPRHERRDRARLAKKATGSNNRAKARLRVARVHAASPTAAGTISTRSPLDSFVRTKRS
jgi:transposase